MSPKYRLRGWRPERIFASLAEKQGISVEQYREQLKARAERFEALGPHISLQAAQTRSFTEEECSHVDQCPLCSELLENIQPDPAEIDRLNAALLARMQGTEASLASPLYSRHLPPLVPARAEPARQPPRYAPVAAVAVAAVLIGGAILWHDMTRTETLLPTDVQGFRSELRLMQSVAANPAQSTDRLFANAAQKQRGGDTAEARAQALRGFTYSDLREPQLQTVAEVLETPPAQFGVVRSYAAHAASRLEQDGDAHPTASDAGRLAEISALSFRAGEYRQGYKYLGRYLTAARPESEAAASFQSNFVEEVTTE
jgi:hypothetical protein